MQETVSNTNDRKSLFSSFLDVLEAKEKQAQAERQLQEDKYRRRTQRIYEFHERQRSEAAELGRCLEYVSQHAAVLEGALRSASGAASEETQASTGSAVPLSLVLARQAAALSRAMAACVRNAADIRRRLAPHHRPLMDALLNKMEAELVGWRGFVQRAADATGRAETAVDNLHNLIAEQRRYLREVSESGVLAALAPAPPADPQREPPADPQREPPADPPAAACSTPIADK